MSDVKALAATPGVASVSQALKPSTRSAPRRRRVCRRSAPTASAAASTAAASPSARLDSLRRRSADLGVRLQRLRHRRDPGVAGQRPHLAEGDEALEDLVSPDWSTTFRPLASLRWRTVASALPSARVDVDEHPARPVADRERRSDRSRMRALRGGGANSGRGRCRDSPAANRGQRAPARASEPTPRARPHAREREHVLSWVSSNARGVRGVPRGTERDLATSRRAWQRRYGLPHFGRARKTGASPG